MRNEAIALEEKRLENVHDISDYHSIHERHRIFPAVFEDRRHGKILDIAAGVGVVGKRIRDNYPADMICNDISPTALQTMKKMGLRTVSFDLDDKDATFPFPDNHFDAIIALATIEHLVHIDHFVREISRMLRDGGCFYLSAPNYSGITYLLPFLLNGKTFHDPMTEPSRYEFYAHIRYFTYHTLLDYIPGFGFIPDTVYVALPESSSRYQLLRRESALKALAFRQLMKVFYRLSPRWAAEPVICFRKASESGNGKPRTVIL